MSVIITLGERHFGPEFECAGKSISPISPHSSRLRFGTDSALNKMGRAMVKRVVMLPPVSG
jgi:hypothetical protein